MNFHLNALRSTYKKDFNFAVLDIETMKWTKFICLGYFDGAKYNEFRSLKKFFDFLPSTEVTNIFAHFGGKFDFLFLLRELLRDTRKIKITNIIPRGSSILCLSVSIDGREFNFRDSSALLPFSLKSITENFETDTRKSEWDHTKTTGWSQGLSDYLRDDCIALYQSIEKFYSWPLIKKAGPAFTTASQALKVFRTFLKDDLKNPGRFANDLVRPSYLGGRTEIFKPACPKGVVLREYDVNSLYPFVMKENFYPVGRAVSTFKYHKNFLGIYEVRVTAPKNLKIPALGILLNKKYVFPVGKFKGMFTSVEIEYAKTLGYSFEFIKGVYYPEKKELFKNFIDDLYAIRLLSNKNSVNDIIAKLLMNSCYGRFGMRLDRENLSFDLIVGSKEFRELKISTKVIPLYKNPVSLKSFTHVAIASFVTSYARIHMHRLMRPIEREVYYTDTDSIFTTAELPTGTQLGALKLEAEYSQGAVFLLPKTYYALGTKKSKIAMKGFDKKKIQSFDLEDFKNALEGDLHRFKITNEPKFASLKQALAKNKIVTMTKASEKRLKALYDKRIIIKKSNGTFETRPIILEEI